MLLSGSENEKLFAKLVPVSMKDVYTSQFRTTHLFLTMEWKEASTGVYSGKVLSITLTDNNDIYFLYNLDLSEDDFQKLKQDQGIRINFPSFPQHIIGYIEKCLDEGKSSQPKYLLVFSHDKPGSMAVPSQLDIVETLEFKHLIHLSLKFIAATESAVRQYQTSVFKRLKEENRQLQNSLNFTEQDLKNKLSTCQHALNCKAQELENVRKELNVELTLKESNHKIELQKEKDQLISKHKDEIDRLEKDIAAKEYNFRKEIQQLESRVNVLDTLNKELQNKNFKHESTIRELKSKVLSLEDEIRHLKENLQSYKHKYDHLQSEVKEKQSHIRQQDEMINDLQQELRSKEQSIFKLKDQIESEIELKKSMENDLENVKFRLDMSEKQRHVLEIDKDRLNEVIINLQEKAKDITKEEKTKGHLVAKYKKNIEDKEKELLDIKKEIAQLNISLMNKDAEIKSLTDTECTLQEKIDDLSTKIKERDNVIKYLNRQLTDRGILPKYAPPSNLATSPSALAQQELNKISSQNHEISPPAVIGKNATTKSVRIETMSSRCKYNSSTPCRSHKAAGTDSAYCTASLHSNQATPEILAGHCNINFNPTDFEADQEALSAAFGNGQHTFKHSTAKKPTKSVKSSTPKNSKKKL